jgi:replicative DNA helicase
VTGSGPHTELPGIAELTGRYENQPVALFVDYIQKVRVTGSGCHDGTGAGQVIESLKELALEQRLVVVAVAAADHVGLEARRLRARHLRGSTALAYDADITVMLNDKHTVVSRAHGHPERAAADRQQVVFSVEKNRNGAPGVHLEFEKDFAHYRFHPHGRRVAERLWSEESNEP